MSAETREVRAQRFTESFNALDWAEAFVGMVKANPSVATDEGTMIGWFANAIMRGYDEQSKRIEALEAELTAVRQLAEDRELALNSWEKSTNDALAEVSRLKALHGEEVQ